MMEKRSWYVSPVSGSHAEAVFLRPAGSTAAFLTMAWQSGTECSWLFKL